jgi:tRNA 2-thiouridine synthesizing protein A
MAKPKSDKQIKFDQYLDAKGLNCPLPILKTKVLLNKMQPDEVLFVEATDSHSQVDFEAYCARTEHSIIKSEASSKGVYSFYIKRCLNPKKI